MADGSERDPQAIVDKIWNAQKKAFEDNKVPAPAGKNRLIPFLYPPEEMDKIIRADIALYDRVVKTLGWRSNRIGEACWRNYSNL